MYLTWVQSLRRQRKMKSAQSYVDRALFLSLYGNRLSHSEEVASVGSHAYFAEACLVGGDIQLLTVLHHDGKGAVIVVTEKVLLHAILLVRPDVGFLVIIEVADLTVGRLNLVAVLECGDGIENAICPRHLVLLANISRRGVFACPELNGVEHQRIDQE